METQIVLEDAKQDMVTIINEIDLHNFDKKEEELTNYFGLLRNLSKVRSAQVVGTIEKERVQDTVQDQVEFMDEIEGGVKENVKPMYLFDRSETLRGGYVPDINGYVPEGVVRSLGLEHGDYVYAEEIESSSPNGRRFHYSFAKEGDRVILKDRIQINYGVVTKVAGRLAVESYIEGSNKKDIKVDGVPHTVILNEQDINYLNIKEGDVVDLAYPKGRPDKHNVLWVHTFERESAPTIEEKAKLFRMTLTKEDGLGNINEVVEKSLIGKSVMIVGDEPHKRHYKKAIEERGGKFLWADAKDSKTSLEAKVSKCDQVIFLLDVCSHEGMWTIKDLCKEYGVPFETPWSKGKSTAVRLAEQRLSV